MIRNGGAGEKKDWKKVTTENSTIQKSMCKPMDQLLIDAFQVDVTFDQSFCSPVLHSGLSTDKLDALKFFFDFAHAGLLWIERMLMKKLIEKTH